MNKTAKRARNHVFFHPIPLAEIDEEAVAAICRAMCHYLHGEDLEIFINGLAAFTKPQQHFFATEQVHRYLYCGSYVAYFESRMANLCLVALEGMVAMDMPANAKSLRKALTFFKGHDVENQDERLQVLQADPEAAKAFFAPLDDYWVTLLDEHYDKAIEFIEKNYAICFQPPRPSPFLVETD